MCNEAHLDFLERSGDKAITNTNYIENDHGFASYKIENNVLHVIQVYGDGKYWEKFFRKIAKENNVTRAMFYTRRNPKAFARRFGAKVVQYIMMIEDKTSVQSY